VDLDETTADIDKRLEELQTELIQKANLKEEYNNIVNEIYRLRDLRQETLSRNALRQDKRDRIAEMFLLRPGVFGFRRFGASCYGYGR
jgi:hypothetical protein